MKSNMMKSNMMKYERIPIGVEAIQYTGQSIKELQKIFGDEFYIDLYGDLTIKDGLSIYKNDWIVKEQGDINIYIDEGFKKIFRIKKDEV